MTKFRLSKSLCSVVGNALQGSHPTLDALFISAGAPGDPPNLAHHSKWKEWLFQAGQDEKVDSLLVLGNVLEEFMEVPPTDQTLKPDWNHRRETVLNALKNEGLEYFHGGRVIPNGADPNRTMVENIELETKNLKPRSVDELILVLLKGLPRAMHPLTHRRKGLTNLVFTSEYDVQDILHALMRPWIADIRSEENTPSYAGSSTRMDFLLPEYAIVIETKIIRDKSHGKTIGEEIILDIDHYRTHPKCNSLWCVIYDPNHFIVNAGGLASDLEGESKNIKGTLNTKIVII